MTDLLAAIEAPDMEPRHVELATAADRGGLLDVAYRTMDSPFGPLLLAATVDGIVRVAFATEDHDEVLERLATDVSPRILRYPARLDDAARELDEYFAGRRRGFDVRSTCASPTASAVMCSPTSARSPSGRRRATRPSPGRRARRRPSVPSAPPAPRTRSRCSCRAIASCAATAPSASTAAASRRSGRCSPSRVHEGRPGDARRTGRRSRRPRPVRR